VGAIEDLLMRMFGRPTGRLGRLGGIIMARANRQFARWVIGLLDIQPHDHVLEVGFGPGVGIEILAELAPAGHIAGVDYSAEMVQQARARNMQAIEAGLVDLRQGTVERLPFADNPFDKALAINSMQVWPDPVVGLRAIQRVLKVGGRCAMGFTRHSRQPGAEVTDLLAAAGFTEARLVQTTQGFCVLANKP
jgi:ubiquinone/menaquinone biosynthesis C-methylase UbiE